MIEIDEKREIWNHVTFVFRSNGVELGKTQEIFVFFQVGISNTSKYSTWREKQGS